MTTDFLSKMTDAEFDAMMASRGESLPAESKDAPRKTLSRKAKAKATRTAYAVTFAIPGKPKSAQTKVFFLPGKAKRRAERLSRRGYEVNVAKVAA